MLVTQQGEVIVQIEQNAEATAQDLKHGNRNLSRAIDIARSTRAVSIKQPLGICRVLSSILNVTIEKMVLLCYLHHPCCCHCYLGLVVCL